MTHKLLLQNGICRQCHSDHSDAMKDIQLPIAEPNASVVEADHTEETTVTEVLMKQSPELEFTVEPELEVPEQPPFQPEHLQFQDEASSKVSMFTAGL